jgi:hypothetical protein
MWGSRENNLFGHMAIVPEIEENPSTLRCLAAQHVSTESEVVD